MQKRGICLKRLANAADTPVCARVRVRVCASMAASVHGNKDEVGGLTCLDRETDCLNSVTE